MSRKTITIITPHYSPEITAGAHRMQAAARVLSSSFKVHVITLGERGSRVENHTMKCDENLTVHYISTHSYNKSFFLIRAFFEWWYSLKLIRKANRISSDLAIVTIPFMFLLPLAARCVKAKKKVADVRDLVWHYLPSSTLLQNFIKKNLTSLMHRSLHKFDAITVTNEDEKRWLIHHCNLSSFKINVISNGISEEKFRKLSEVKFTPHPQKYTITYVGNIGNSQQFDSLIEAVKEMKDIRLNLIGDGNALVHLQKLVSSKKITNVSLPGKLRWMRAMPYYQTSDLLFASLKDNYKTAIPSKLFEYLSTGLPVLYQGKGAAADLLKNFSNTFVIPGDDPKSLEKLIWRIKKMASARSVMNIQIIRKNFVREKVSMKFNELSARLLNEKVLSDVFVEDLISTKY